MVRVERYLGGYDRDSQLQAPCDGKDEIEG